MNTLLYIRYILVLIFKPTKCIEIIQTGSRSEAAHESEVWRYGEKMRVQEASLKLGNKVLVKSHTK